MYENLAKEILAAVGGKENVKTATHCATRLRLVLNDESKVDKEKVEAVEKVAGSVFAGGQYQVIIGLAVPDVHAEFVKLLDGETATKEEVADKKDNAFNRFFKSLVGIMTPTFGIMGAAGILKGLLILATTTGVLKTTDGAYQVLYAVAQGFFYFLPIWVGFSASKVFKGNQMIGATLAAALVFPDIVALTADNASLTFFGIPIVLVSYSQTLFPAILTSYVAAKLENFIRPKLHESIRMMITPLLVLLIVTPLAFLAIGPLMSVVSNVLSTVFMSIYGFSPIIFGVLMGAFWQVVVVFGLHYAFIPVLINNITTNGFDPLNAIFNVTVFALAGTAIGFAFKTKDAKEKSIGFSTGVTGLMGITEPILYSVALPYRRQFIYAFIGGGIAGAWQAFMGANIYGFGNGGLFAFPLFIAPDGNMNSLYSTAVAFAIAFFVPLVLTLVLGTGEKKAD